MPNKAYTEALSRLGEIPHLDCGHYPTPLEEMVRLRALLGTSARLFIKHDDLTGPGFGGNKVRKLEYVLARALEDATEIVITVGGERSNHARITAALAARLGLRSILVLNDAAEGPKGDGSKPASLALDELFGAEIHRVRTREERLPKMRALASELRTSGYRVVEIPLGASVPLGAMGYVRAAEELAGQLSKRGLSVNYIFHASSSGGTQAGLEIGCRLSGLETKIVGVSPDDPSASIAAEVKAIMTGVCELLEINPTDVDHAVTVVDDFVGPGYGVSSAESTAAMQLLARTEGVVLDPVYTAKAMAALLSWITNGRLTEGDNALFWHTGGQLALFSATEAL